MDPYDVNPTLSIFLPTPFPVAMQGLGATSPHTMPRYHCFYQLENWNMTFKRVLSKVICKIILPRIYCFDQMETGIGRFKQRYWDFPREKFDKMSLMIIKWSHIWILFSSLGFFNFWQYHISKKFFQKRSSYTKYIHKTTLDETLAICKTPYKVPVPETVW